MRFNKTAFDLSPLQESTIIKTAIEFQAALSESDYARKYGWEPFDVSRDTPKSLEGIETGFHSNRWVDEIRSCFLEKRQKVSKKV